MFSNLLLQLIVFFLPTQLGLHFWPAFSRAAGIKVDYLSPTLYFTDLLLLAFCFLNFASIFKWLKKYLLLVISILVFVLLNSLLGLSPLNSLLWWSRNLLYLLFFLTLCLRRVSWLQIKTSLLTSTILVVFLEIFQFLHQGSAGGLFYWLGERSFTSSTPGLGRLSWFGLDLIRPQSTFSHPNSLAGYLLLVYFLFQHFKSPLWSKMVVFTGLILALSKGALLAFLLVFTFQLNSLFLILGFLVLALGQILLPQIIGSYRFIADRLFLLAPAKTIISRFPIWGVGLGNFIPALGNLLPGSFLLPAKLQPVHNIFLLGLSELGLVGVTFFAVLGQVVRPKSFKPSIWILISLIVITGSFDHYWWTLPQNKLILLLVAAVL